MTEENVAKAIQIWQSKKIEMIVWDSTRSHKLQSVKEIGLILSQQPPYSPRLNSAERIVEKVQYL